MEVSLRDYRSRKSAAVAICVADIDNGVGGISVFAFSPFVEQVANVDDEDVLFYRNGNLGICFWVEDLGGRVGLVAGVGLQCSRSQKTPKRNTSLVSILLSQSTTPNSGVDEHTCGNAREHSTL